MINGFYEALDSLTSHLSTKQYHTLDKQHNPSFNGANDALFVVLLSLLDDIQWSADTLVVYKIVKV